ncbi:hypothetical protein NDU88_008025 [Pleurodeles waltl]|uniref:Uncharacterized protein n=1 Tax=Pleurodeles waltl TaxID=8319 RepID=A0AAV7SUH4_PLEWA|nr:hypothetical protein NDU88_008025 [Pleurodeles waltl]
MRTLCGDDNRRGIFGEFLREEAHEPVKRDSCHGNERLINNNNVNEALARSEITRALFVSSGRRAPEGWSHAGRHPPAVTLVLYGRVPLEIEICIPRSHRGEHPAHGHGDTDIRLILKGVIVIIRLKAVLIFN